MGRSERAAILRSAAVRAICSERPLSAHSVEKLTSSPGEAGLTCPPLRMGELPFDTRTCGNDVSRVGHQMAKTFFIELFDQVVAGA